jgi:hypothetical protein
MVISIEKFCVVSDHSGKMATPPNSLNGDFSKGFTIPQVAQKYDWHKPMAWGQALLTGISFQTRIPLSVPF